MHGAKDFSDLCMPSGFQISSGSRIESILELLEASFAALASTFKGIHFFGDDVERAVNYFCRFLTFWE